MPIFVFGHKNPDTDSVCSSIALSYLKNEQGMKTVPKVLGNINAETKFILDYFKVDVPSYLNDVRVRIKNIKYDKKAYINENKSIDAAFRTMQKQNITAIPLVDDNKKLSGYVTLKEIAKYLVNGNRDVVNTTLDNIIETLNANVIVKCDDLILGNILIAGLQSKTFEKEIDLKETDILIVGDRYKVLDYAISSHVKLIILPLNVNLDKKLIMKARKNNVNIIATELDSFKIATKITLSNLIKNININKKPVKFNNEDYFSDFKTMTHKINHTNYPVVNNKNECLGLIRLTGPNSYERQKVILVDHNDLAQTVDGIEEAEIVEVIDHHNLGSIGTPVPINFRSKPVGCTATIIYDMFLEAKVTIPKPIAGILLSAILSDTLIFTSPTTTADDKYAAVKLASIAKVDIDKYGLEMLKAGTAIDGKSVKELINLDFKTYEVNDKKIGIGQIFTLDFNYIKNQMDEFVSNLNDLASKESYNVVAIFVTDIIKNGSYIIFNENSKNIISDGFGITDAKEGVYVPKIVSRKKEFLPSIINALED